MSKRSYGKVTESLDFKEGWYDLEVIKEEVHSFSYGDVLELTFMLPNGEESVSIATIREDISPRTKLYKWAMVLLGNPPGETPLKEGDFEGKKCRGFVRIQVGSRGPFLKVVTVERHSDRPRRVKPNRHPDADPPG